MANTKKYVSLDKLTKYDELLKAKIAADDATALQSAKDYADGLAKNYDAAGTAATEAGKVQANLDTEVARAKAAEEANAAAAKKAQDEVDALELVVAGKAAQTDLDALAGKVGNVPEGSTVIGMINEINENAYDDTQLRADMATELGKKADKTQVATDIENAVAAETSARETAVAGVQSAVDALSGTHATDKAALEAAIALKADQTALDAVSGVANAAATKAEFDAAVEALEAEDERIAGLVTAEVAKAREEEGKLDARLVEVETFFKTAEGETIDQAMDTLVEIQKYITEDGAAADQMVKDIAANKTAIETHAALNHDFAAADATLKEELNAEIAKKATIETVNGIDGRLTTAEGKITTAEGKITTLEGKMTTVEGTLSTKADQTSLDQAVEALEGADEGQIERIAALEAKFGGAEGSVEDMIADAKQEAIDAAAADATTKANNAKDAAIAKANELDTAMDARMDVVEAKAHEHANKALLDTYTQTEANLADAVAKKHAHSNLEVLEGITAAKVTAWDTVTSKADQTALQAEIDRAKAAEKVNADAIAAFVEVSEEEINKLFETAAPQA